MHVCEKTRQKGAKSAKMTWEKSERTRKMHMPHGPGLLQVATLDPPFLEGAKASFFSAAQGASVAMSNMLTERGLHRGCSAPRRTPASATRTASRTRTRALTESSAAEQRPRQLSLA